MRGRTLVAGAAAGDRCAAVPAGAAITPRRDRRGVSAATTRASFGAVSASTPAAAQTRATPIGNPVGTATPDRWRPSRATAPTFLVLSTGDATHADQPDQPGTFPERGRPADPIRERGDAALDVTVLQISFTDPTGQRAALSPAASLRLPLPVRGVPEPPRQRLQRRLRRRARRLVVDDVGAPRSRRPTTSRCAHVRRPAGDDQVAGRVACRPPRRPARRTARPPRAAGAGPRARGAGRRASALPLALRPRRPRRTTARSSSTTSASRRAAPAPARAASTRSARPSRSRARASPPPSTRRRRR